MARRAISIGMMLAVASATANAQQRVEVPTAYEAGHFYATPTLQDGRSLRLVVDTGGGGGGGLFVFNREAVVRLGLATKPCTLDGQNADVVGPLPYQPGRNLPVQNKTPCDAPALVIRGGADIEREDGQLGAGYLPGHVWTFDYPARKLWLEPGNWRPAQGMHRVPLGFPRDDKGVPLDGFARIAVDVGGETIHLLLDTGATAHPSDAGKAAGTEVTAKGVGVTSYITTSQLERWHKAHPEWRVIAGGDDLMPVKGGMRLIEVPSLVVGAWRVGPIWFTERPDESFSTAPGHMGSFMEGPIVGALGGNVYRHFRMTLDYPGANAWLACAQGCSAASR